jgi:hypothetical protein
VDLAAALLRVFGLDVLSPRGTGNLLMRILFEAAVGALIFFLVAAATLVLSAGDSFVELALFSLSCSSSFLAEYSCFSMSLRAWRSSFFLSSADMNSFAASAMPVAGEVRLKREEEEEEDDEEGGGVDIVLLSCLWSNAGVITMTLGIDEAFTGVEGASLPPSKTDCSTESSSRSITSRVASCIAKPFFLSRKQA